ncbi:MAG: ATP-binding protein [bacterium]|nr:ATP-binding protein [bacterium]
MRTTTTTDSLKERAKALKLHGLLAHWDEVRDAAWLEPLIRWEEEERARRGLQRRLSSARLGRFKPLADFDWNWPKQCDRQVIEELMRLDFLAQSANAVLVGPNGVGKSTIARNIAHQAVLAGHSVLFTNAAAMLNELAAQDGDNALRRRLALYARPRLLVIDEIGYLSYSNRHADLLFEIVSRRYEEKSTLVTTNKPFAEWNQVFPNASCVVSLVDRLVHHAEIIPLEGESYRLKEAKEQSEKRRQQRAAAKRKRTKKTPEDN